mgnify:FL=1
MNSFDLISPSWTTSAFGDAADTSPMELSALGEHKDSCNGSRGRWFKLRCAVDAMHGAVAARFVTTLVVLAALIGIGSAFA